MINSNNQTKFVDSIYEQVDQKIAKIVIKPKILFL